MSKVVDRFIPKVDLRGEMVDIANETAYEVLIQRSSEKIRCTCFNDLYKEADPKCPKCVGTGWLFKFEKQRCVKQDFIATSDGNTIFTAAGNLIEGYSKFFFPYDSSITRKDYIWEVAFKNGKPIKLIALYQVVEFSNQRGTDGKTEYKICIVKDEPFDKDFKNLYIGKAWRDIK